METTKAAENYTIGATAPAYGIGNTFTGTDDHDGQRVALRAVFENQPAEEELARQFHKFTYGYSALKHPNIASVHGTVWTGQDLLLVEDWVEGETLAARMNRGRLSPTEAIAIAEQALAALAYTHENGFCHRAVSAESFRIGPGGELKLTGFCMGAQPFGPQEQPHYFSPERARGAELLNERSDVYSFGAVFYQMITGRHVFEGSGFNVLRGHIEELPKPPSSIEPELSPALDEVVLKCLSKHPGNRYPSAVQLAQAIEKVKDSALGTPAKKAKKKPQQGQADDHAPVTAEPEKSKNPVQSRLFSFAILCAFGVIGLLLSAAVQFVIPSPPPAPQQEEQVTDDSGKASAQKPTPGPKRPGIRTVGQPDRHTQGSPAHSASVRSESRSYAPRPEPRPVIHNALGANE